MKSAILSLILVPSTSLEVLLHKTPARPHTGANLETLTGNLTFTFYAQPQDSKTHLGLLPSH